MQQHTLPSIKIYIPGFHSGTNELPVFEKKSDSIKFSTALSFYPAVGIQPYLQLSLYWSLGIGSSYRHISNGGIKLPNKDINWVTGEINLMYYPQPQFTIEPLLNRHRKQTYTKTNQWDVYVFAAIRSIDNADKKHNH